VRAQDTAQLAATLLTPGREQSTGKVTIAARSHQWEFYYLRGQLLYAIGGPHRTRRWERAVRQCCPKFRFDPERISPASLWEYQLLANGLSRQHINLKQAKAVLVSVIKEVLLSLMAASPTEATWVPSRRSPARKTSPLPLAVSEVEQLLHETSQLWHHWQEKGLDYLQPDRAPTLQEPSANSEQAGQSTLVLSQLFNGQNTVWDIAAQQKRSPLDVARTLHHFVQKGKLALCDVTDLPSPMAQLQMVSAAVKPPAPCIACIDDSAAATKHIETILIRTGYRVVCVRDPLAEMSRLLEEKPDLIFLDVVMPTVDGRDLCNFLRKTSVFRETPIVILTSCDGAIDRVRANLSGASDFLSKPADPQKVLEMTRKHIPAASVPSLPFKIQNSELKMKTSV